MPKHRADDFELLVAEEYFEELPEFRHIRVRAWADLLVLESGDRRDPVRHARLRRVSAQYWRLEMPTHARRWERTPIRDELTAVLDWLTHEFDWTLAQIDEADEA